MTLNHVRRTVESVRRLRSSSYGNPRWEFTFTDGSVLKSEPNAGWAYSITGNEAGRDFYVTTNRRGNISRME